MAKNAALEKLEQFDRTKHFVMRSKRGVRYRFEETCSACPQQWTVHVGDSRAVLNVSMRGHGFYVYLFPDGDMDHGAFYRVLTDDLRKFDVRQSEFSSIKERNVHLRRAIEAIDLWYRNEAAGIPNVGLPSPHPLLRWHPRAIEGAVVLVKDNNQ